MGSCQSLPGADEPPSFAMVAFPPSCTCDTVRLIHGGGLFDVVQRAITRGWPDGIQSVKEYVGVIDIKLHGRPFAPFKKSQILQSRRLCCEILSYLYTAGWKLVASSSFTKEVKMSTWTLQSIEGKEQKETEADERHNICCIYLSECDKIFAVSATEQLILVLRELITKFWSPGIQSESTTGKDHVFKLKGRPWDSLEFEKSLVESRTLIMHMIIEFARCKWSFYGASNPQNTRTSVDTLFFNYDQDAQVHLTDVFILGLHSSDSLHVIQSPEELYSDIQNCIHANWPKGIQKENACSHRREIKLKGNPWTGAGEDAVLSRMLVLSFLQEFRRSGWKVLATVDLTNRIDDTSDFVFYRTHSDGAPVPHFCISFNESDKIRLMNAPESVKSDISRVIRRYWREGVAHENEYYGSHEFKLNGLPWIQSWKDDQVVVRGLLCFIVDTLWKTGWELVSSADVDCKWVYTENSGLLPHDSHSWFFARRAAVQNESVSQ